MFPSCSDHGKCLPCVDVESLVMMVALSLVSRPPSSITISPRYFSSLSTTHSDHHQLQHTLSRLPSIHLNIMPTWVQIYLNIRLKALRMGHDPDDFDRNWGYFLNNSPQLNPDQHFFWLEWCMWNQCCKYSAHRYCFHPDLRPSLLTGHLEPSSWHRISIFERY